MLSYEQGSRLTLSERTTGEQLAHTAALYGDSDAIVSRHQKLRITWRELLAMADRVAGGLAALDVRPGDRVGLWSTNCVEWVLLHMACARAGVVLVNVNPASRVHELGFVIVKSRMKALFFWPRDERANYDEILAATLRSLDAPGLRHTVRFGSDEWQRILDAPAAAPVECKAGDVANIQYTSGTTGSPKGVLLTHRNLVNNGLLIANTLRYTEADRICVPVPLSHCFGCVIGTMAALATGAALILPHATYDALRTLEAIEAERATSVYGVPTMFIAELRHPEFARFDMSSLRTGVMAGAPCPVEVMKQVQAEMHCPEVTIAYGLTETAPVLTMSAIDDTLERRVSTVGRPLPETEIRIADPETGALRERGVQGEIQARGYMVMQGYDGEPEATARSIDPDGWFHTGDLGVMREDGYLKVTGRAKDMIIRGGENIYPREIEEFLYTHPKIAEVHVTGLPDEKLGEIVLAWIRLKPGEVAEEEEVKAFCKGQIAYFRIPEAIRFVDAFPTTLSGKIQKFRIREIEIEKRGLQRAAQVETA